MADPRSAAMFVPPVNTSGAPSSNTNSASNVSRSAIATVILSAAQSHLSTLPSATGLGDPSNTSGQSAVLSSPTPSVPSNTSGTAGPSSFTLATVSSTPPSDIRIVTEISPSSSQRRPISVKKELRLWDSNTFVHLYAGMGADAPHFMVHKDWVCYHSPVLHAAFNSSFIEGQTQEYCLDIPEIDKNVVHLLIHWIYSQEVVYKQIISEEDEANGKDLDVIFFEALVKLYILADKLLIPGLQNATIEAINEVSDEYYALPLESIEYVYKHTSEESLLRKYIVNLCAAEKWGVGGEAVSEQAPRKFLLDVVQALQDSLTSGSRRMLVPRTDMSIFMVDKSIGNL